MNLKEYCNWTGNTCAKLETLFEDNIHMLFGMMTEIGELIDVYKKDLAYKKPIDIVNVKEEIGDIMFYIASFCRINNLNLDEIISTNVKKLESRYPERFTEYHANNRDLDKERSILESK
jgi:NTP pyrophosphatase (non-canonical NTP hydrolase)